MTKILTILCLGVFVLQAQDITNKLGGTTKSETYDITDSNSNVLFRIQGNGKVGIGTDKPDAILDIHGTVKAFGALIDTFSTEIVHQANTDGIIVAYLRGGTSESTTIYGYTDSNPIPVTIVAEFSVNLKGATGTIMMPVKKGNYWKVTDSVAGFNTDIYKISWIPLGQ